MKRFEWLSEYLARLHDEHILVRGGSSHALAPAHRLTLDAEDWSRTVRLAHEMGCRFAGVWGDQHLSTKINVYACLEFRGDYLILKTTLPLHQPALSSLANIYPGADRLERHLQDLFGITLLDHPDNRRWTRHQAWTETDFPLRSDFPTAGKAAGRTRADADYPFAQIHGSGVYEIPVGPVHAGIIEPGHFRFQAVGEEVLRLEERLGYVHKGIEKIAMGRDAAGLVRLAGRVSGDSTLAHAWAACQAMERAAGCVVPPRAQSLRGLLCERERVANHLGDIGAICNDVGFAFAHVQCSRLREQWQRRNASLLGHRLLMDTLVPGGVCIDLTANDIAELRDDHAALRRETRVLFDVIDDHPSLEDRLLSTGYLSADDARDLGCTGYVGKASGQPFDVRRDTPYPPYDRLSLPAVEEQDGDVAARVRVRMSEIESSLVTMEQLLDALPDGETAAPFAAPKPGAKGMGFVDGWRGEVLCFIRFGENGRITRFFPRDPSWFTWPALERLIMGNIVADFPVCNKSVNGSYSGQDL
ncbi:MAG: NADH-quinone oxidoreductase subunit C [Candidatus Thiodiazotropha sp.]